MPTTTKPLTNKQLAIGFFLGSGLVSFGGKALADSSIIKSIANNTNTDAQDLVDVTTMGLFDFGLSYVFDNSFIREDTIINSLIQILTTSKAFNKIVGKVPLLNKLNCTNKDCEGICPECQYQQVIKQIPLKVAAYYVKDVTSYKGGPIPNGECPICFEEDQPLYRSCNNQGENPYGICRDCSGGIVAAAVAGNNPLCPHCRDPLRQPPAVGVVEPDNHQYAYNQLMPDTKILSFANLATCFISKTGIGSLVRGLQKSVSPFEKHLKCPNQQCKGICNQCKLKHLHRWNLEIFVVKIVRKLNIL